MAGFAQGGLWRTLAAAGVFLRLVTSRRNREARGQRFLYLTEGRSFARNYAAFGATSQGAALLAERPDFHAILSDRARLRACAPGSFGHAYIAFLTAHGFDEEAYMDGARAAAAHHLPDAAQAWYRMRADGAHDVRHVVSGYGPEMLGEACILVMRHAQLGHPGALFMAGLAALATKATEGGRVLPPLMEAYRRARAARLLDLVVFERNLDTPLETLRAELGLAPSPAYETWVKARRRRSQSREGAVALAPSAT